MFGRLSDMFGVPEGRVSATDLSVQPDDDGLDAATRSLLVVALVVWDKLLGCVSGRSVVLRECRRPHALLCCVDEAESGRVVLRVTAAEA